MSSCCDPSGYAALFSAKEGRRNLHSYRRKGLDELATAIVNELAATAPGASVLEVGGGIGAVGIELLAAGAASAHTVEISDGYQAAALQLALEEGVADRVEHTVADFVTVAGDVPAADIVVLNRVVCCYPDMEAMVDAAADKSVRRLAMTFPRDRWFMGVVRRFIAAGMWIRRNSFRFFVHDPEAIVRTAVARGMRPVFTQRTAAWEAVILARP